MPKNRAKRLALIAIVAVLVICSLATLVACSGNSLQQKLNDMSDKLAGFEENEAVKNVTIFVGSSGIAFQTKQNKLTATLTEMVEQSKISTFNFNGGEFGAYLTGINGVTAGANEYFAIYHTIDDVTLKGTDFSTGEILKKYAFGKDFFYSNVGISQLPIVDGASYLIVLEKF
ncbi:MAG: hypothetical protein RR338_05520 [Clostridia bacterium]